MRTICLCMSYHNKKNAGIVFFTSRSHFHSLSLSFSVSYCVFNRLCRWLIIFFCLKNVYKKHENVKSGFQTKHCGYDNECVAKNEFFFLFSILLSVVVFLLFCMEFSVFTPNNVYTAYIEQTVLCFGIIVITGLGFFWKEFLSILPFQDGKIERTSYALFSHLLSFLVR